MPTRTSSSRPQATPAKKKPAGKGRARSRSGPPLVGVVALGLVLIVVIVLIGVKLASSGSGAAGSDNQPVPAPVLAEMEQIPAATFDTVGKGTASINPVVLPGPPLQSGGKPELLYVGAEYCP